MPHVDAPAGAPSLPDAAMISLDPQRAPLGASGEGATPEPGPPAPLAAGPFEVVAVASGPYRIAFGCTFEAASARRGEREFRS